MISVCFQGKPFNITVIQVYAPSSNAEEAKVEWLYALQDLLELTPQKDVIFFWNAKVGSQEIPRVPGNLAMEYKMKQGKANTVLPREHIGHGKHPLLTTQEKTLHMDIIR